MCVLRWLGQLYGLRWGVGRVPWMVQGLRCLPEWLRPDRAGVEKGGVSQPDSTFPSLPLVTV